MSVCFHARDPTGWIDVVMVDAADHDEAHGMNARAALTSVSRDGLVTRLGVVEAGVPLPSFDRWVREGEWVEWDNSVYGHATVVRSFRRRALAATLACGDAAVASHFTAGYLHGLFEIRRPSRIEVTTPFDEIRAPRTATAHRSRHLDEDDLSEAVGVPVTSPARTICDLSPRITVGHLEQLIVDGVRRGQVSVEALTIMVERLGRTRAGSRKLRRLLGEIHPDAARLRSTLEVVAYPVIRATALPGLRLGYLVRDRSGREAYELDFAYPEVKLAIEIDGMKWHASRRQLERDQRRQNWLTEQGWTVLRFSLGDLRDRPAWVATQIRSVHERLSAAKRDG